MDFFQRKPLNLRPVTRKKVILIRDGRLLFNFFSDTLPNGINENVQNNLKIIDCFHNSSDELDIDNERLVPLAKAELNRFKFFYLSFK